MNVSFLVGAAREQRETAEDNLGFSPALGEEIDSWLCCLDQAPRANEDEETASSEQTEEEDKRKTHERQL